MKDQVPKNPAISESRYWLVQWVFATHGIDAFRSLFSFQRTWHFAAGILRYHDLRFESSGKLRHRIRFFTPMRRPECGLHQRLDGHATERHRGSRLFGGDFYNISQVPGSMQHFFCSIFRRFRSPFHGPVPAILPPRSRRSEGRNLQAAKPAASSLG